MDKKPKKQKTSVHFKKISLEGKLPSSDDKAVQEACSKLNLLVKNSTAPWISCFQGREKKTGEKHHSRKYMLGEQGRCRKAVDQSWGGAWSWNI